MKTKYIFVLILLCVSTTTFSQKNLNNYKYVIVPNSFNFLKSEDQYQLNSLAQFLFNKYGFTAIMEDDSFRQDLVNNGCLALRSDVEKLSGLFKIKLVVVLKNCRNETVFKSEVGETREKDYKKAYSLALRDAFKSLETVNYSYKAADDKIVSVSAETNNLETQQIKTPLIVEPVEAKSLIIIKETNQILYAQEIENGFQVVDATPKVILILLSTPKQDTFIVKDRNAIVYKEDGFWYLSESDGKSTTTKTLNIKF